MRKYMKNDKYSRFTVYDNRTDMPIIVCGTAVQCALVMGISANTFYALASENIDNDKRGNRWVIIREFLDENELDDYNRG